MFANAQDNELNNSLPFKHAFADIYNAAQLVSKKKTDRPCCLVQYVLDPEIDCFFILFFDGANIKYGKLASNGELVTIGKFLILYSAYSASFLKSNNIISGESFNRSKIAWQSAYSLFIAPILSLVPRYSRVLTIFKCIINDVPYLLDFSSLYNLQYRFLEYYTNERVHFTTVTTDTMFSFVKNLFEITYPLAQQIVLISGLHFSDGSAGSDVADSETNLVLKAVSQAIQRNGGRVRKLQSIEDFSEIFKKGEEGALVQLIAHFHKRRLYTCTSKSIGFGSIQGTIEMLKTRNNLRNDIVIDAITCTNFDSFRFLYNANIKYLHMSHHDLSTEIAIAMLYELHTGTMAKRIGWNFPYLDGKSYIHEAWANVNRCYFAVTRMGGANQTFN